MAPTKNSTKKSTEQPIKKRAKKSTQKQPMKPAVKPIPKPVTLLPAKRVCAFNSLGQIVDLYYGNSTSGWYRDHMPTELQKVPYLHKNNGARKSKKGKEKEKTEATKEIETVAVQPPSFVVPQELHTTEWTNQEDPNLWNSEFLNVDMSDSDMYSALSAWRWS